MTHEQQMRKRGSGAIGNCSSIGGIVGLALIAAYHGTKHGVIGLTRSAAVESAARHQYQFSTASQPIKRSKARSWLARDLAAACRYWRGARGNR